MFNGRKFGEIVRERERNFKLDWERANEFHKLSRLSSEFILTYEYMPDIFRFISNLIN